MCGISGFLGFNQFKARQEIENLSAAMARSLVHRGPDDSGRFIDYQNQIALIHTRLSILDLSKSGAQPMTSSHGRYVICFNGEIYNHKELRVILHAHYFRGTSDTETLLACIEHFGLVQTLDKVVGAFALALWDKQEQVLTLARDRFGEKPIYYLQTPSGLAFASEARTLKYHKLFDGELDTDSLNSFLSLGYVPTPNSIYKNIKKILPGTYTTYFLNSNTVQKSTSKSGVYYSIARNSIDVKSSYDERKRSLNSLLRDSVCKQLISDVPIGVFLSGGIDSTLIASIASEYSVGNLNTFSIGFDDPLFDESKAAESISKHLGTNHNSHKISIKDIIDVIPKIPLVYSEPFADYSQIPTFLVSQLASNSVKVVLTGDGGDELFGGYNRYIFSNSYWPTIQRIPQSLRFLLVELLNIYLYLFSRTRFDFEFFSSYNKINQKLKNKIKKIISAIHSESDLALYRNFIRKNSIASSFMRAPREVKDSFHDIWSSNQSVSTPDLMMMMDLNGYLNDDILVKVDRATMYNSIEARVPFLDHRVVDYAHSLPLSDKIHGSIGKVILRDIVKQYVPKGLLSKDKAGFGIPLAPVLRGPLRDWVESLLKAPIIERSGHLDSEKVKECWRAFLEGNDHYFESIWNTLMFLAWYENEKASQCY